MSALVDHDWRSLRAEEADAIAEAAEPELGLWVIGPDCGCCGQPRWTCTPTGDFGCKCSPLPDPTEPF